MREFIVINIVSGKGGTGKTLLCAVLADMLGNTGVSVLVVDLDIYVRGLTALLYFHKKESLNLIPSSQLSVANVFVEKIKGSKKDDKRKPGISRYRSFDVLPAVSRIDEQLNFNDILPDSKREATSILNKLLDIIPTDYDLVILDSRAGYDGLIAATHGISDASVCVEEEDSISKVTADNLVSQLKNDAPIPLFRLTNKARTKRTASELDDEPRAVTELGRIPFDIDVMNSFGQKDFWEGMSRSLYRGGVTRVWNRLATKLGLKWELEESRISPLASTKLEEHLGAVSWRDRVLLVYGLLLAVVGFGYAFLDPDTVNLFTRNPIRLVALLSGIGGGLLTLFVILRLGRRP